MGIAAATMGPIAIRNGAVCHAQSPAMFCRQFFTGNVSPAIALMSLTCPRLNTLLSMVDRAINRARS